MRWSDRIKARKPRGWSISNMALRTVTEGRGGDRYLRMFWVSRRKRFITLGLWVLALCGAYNLIASDHGVARLRALHREEAGLNAQHAALIEEYRQATNQVTEDPAVSIERGLREKYRKSRPGEIVYRTKILQQQPVADSSAISGAQEDGR
jgi:cell division protein FtsB